jgi:uncharacterized repeat protein (TIGR01451 family)
VFPDDYDFLLHLLLTLNIMVSTHFGRQPRHLLTGFIVFASFAGWGQSAIAEGSRELVQNGGNRPFTEWRTNATAGMLRRTVLKVYANAGEVINLGSSGVNVGAGNIKLFSDTANVDSATPLVDCKVAQPGTGILDTRAKELAGPLPATGGYTPCVYTAPTSGIYQVTFYGPDGSTGANDASTSAGIDYIANPLINTNQKSSVSLWDITVRSNAAATADLNGRVFTDYVAMIMGSNGRYLKSNFYILTDDGYRYKTDLSNNGAGSGIDPNGFLFFANEKGLLLPGGLGQPLYHTGQKIGDNFLTPPLDGGVTLQPPTYPTFFNPPSNAAVSGIGYPLIAQKPAAATNFLFTAGTGGSGNQSLQGVGGTFSFDAPQSGTYQIVIDVNNDGAYNVLNGDRILEGSMNAGSNSTVWDGKDGNGTALPPRSGNAPYNAKIILKGGEYHFPLIDAESAATGFRIQMLNPPSPFPAGTNATTIYFDDRNYSVDTTNINLNCSATVGLPICDARTGVDSALGAHKYGTNTSSQTDYGDKKILDTWIYFPSDPTYTPLIVVSSLTPPNLRLVKRVSAIGATAITGFNDVTTGAQAADDNAPGWIANYLQGAFGTSQIPIANRPNPKDEVEYTIYFLSDGGLNAQGVALCDFVPNDSTYVANSLTLAIGTGTPTPISDATGDADGGFYPNLSTFPSACSTGANQGNGGVVVNVGTVNRSTGVGIPATSYGFIRFRAKVN